MTETDNYGPPSGTGSGRHDTQPGPLDEAAALRVLALTDRIIGLEAELAEAQYRADMAQLGHDAAIAREADLVAFIDEMRRSSTWRAGRILGAPLRGVRWIAVPSARRRRRPTGTAAANGAHDVDPLAPSESEPQSGDEGP